jgi:hypothetical protein
MEKESFERLFLYYKYILWRLLEPNEAAVMPINGSLYDQT